MTLKQNNAWLFGFTDLAFLLLISLSIIPTAPEDPPIQLSLMEVPGVPANPNLAPIKKTTEIWELHVYLESPETEQKLYKLIGKAVAQPDAPPIYEKFLSKGELLGALQELKRRGIQPILIPSQNSLSHDFLYAAGAIAQIWGADRGEAIVKPLNPGEDNQE